MKFALPKSADVSLMKLFFIFIALPTILVLITIFTMQKEIKKLKVTHEVFFEIEIDGRPEGRIVFALFGEIAPQTVRNFYTFSTTGFGGKKYAGTKFHRIIKKFMIQGGDVINNDGTGQPISIYGETFPDETFEILHSTSGYLSMANSGKNTNGCQFFVTTRETDWLDGKHVAFGKVIAGQSLVHKIEYLDADPDGRPLKEVKIAKTGATPLADPYYISSDPYNIADWLKTISVPLGVSFTIIFIFSRFMKELDSCIEAEEQLLKKEREMKRALKEPNDKDTFQRELSDEAENVAVRRKKIYASD